MAEPPSDATLVVRSRDLEAVVLPGKGADVYSLVDRATGVEVLYRSPWGWRDPASVPPMGSSEADWLARYPGGWQLLVPNAGPERDYDGARRGFHGEAATVAWTVAEHTTDTARLTTDLTSAPLHVEREFVADGTDFRVTTRLRNLSAFPVPVMYVEHAGFGAPFLDGRCRLDTGARTVAAATGYDEIDDVTVLPGPGEGRSSFAGLTGYDDAWISIASPSAGFGLRLSWDARVLPHAWLWQEAGGVTGYPWFGRAYVVGIEPANVLPDDGLDRCPVLAPHGNWSSTVTLSRF